MFFLNKILNLFFVTNTWLIIITLQNTWSGHMITTPMMHCCHLLASLSLRSCSDWSHVDVASHVSSLKIRNCFYLQFNKQEVTSTQGSHVNKQEVMSTNRKSHFIFYFLNLISEDNFDNQNNFQHHFTLWQSETVQNQIRI